MGNDSKIPHYVTHGRLTDDEFRGIEEHMEQFANTESPLLADRYLRMMYQEWRAAEWERNEAQDKLQLKG